MASLTTTEGSTRCCHSQRGACAEEARPVNRSSFSLRSVHDSESAMPPAVSEVVVLVAQASDGTDVERHELSLQEYYEGLHKLIDSGAYRSGRGIAFIEGKLY